MDPPEIVESTSICENKLTTYKESAHFIEQKLKYGKKGEKSGIKLTSHEDRMTHVLMILYKKKTRDNNKNSEVTTRTVKYGSKNPQDCITVTILCTEKELLNEFYGKKKPSGSDIKHLRDVLQQLAQKKFHIQYTKVISKKGEKSFVDETEPLIKIHSIVDAKNTKRTKTYKIGLHPIFTDQIDTKYVLFTECIHERTVEASERIVTDSTIRLRDYLLSEMSAGRYKSTIGEQKLIDRLYLQKYLLIRRKNKALDQILKSIKTCIKLGIISKVEVSNGVENPKNYVFHLQKLTGLRSHPYGVEFAK